LGASLAWLLDGELGRDKLALLVLCTLSISVLAAQVRWRLRRSPILKRGILGRTWVGRWLLESLRLFFCVGIPLTLLGRGALVREMGLPLTLVGEVQAGDAVPAWTWISRVLAWLELTDALSLARLGAGLAVGVGALVTLVAVWVWYERTVLASADFRFEGRPGVSWADAVRQALLAQFLWAFYRGVSLLLVPQRAQAALLALGLISIPWALHPRHRRDLLSTRGYQVVQEWLLALFTVLVSLATNQLWFLIVMHTLWVWVSGRLLAHLAESSLLETGITPAI
jgi:hypothetical protein